MNRLTSKYLIHSPVVFSKSKTISNRSHLACEKTHTQHETPSKFITRHNIEVWLNELEERRKILSAFTYSCRIKKGRIANLQPI